MSNVNIVYTLRCGVTFVGITLLGVVHPIQDNFSGAGHAAMGGSHSEPQEWRKPACGFMIFFVIFLD